MASGRSGIDAQRAVGRATTTRSAIHDRHRLQRRREAGRVGPAGLGHVRPAAALAADLRGDVIDKLAGLDPVGEIRGHAGDERHLAAFGRAQHDGRRLEPALQLIEGLAQDLGVRALDRGGQHLGAVDVDRLRGEIAALAGREPRLEPRDFLLQGAHVVEHVRDFRRHFRRWRLERPRRFVQPRLGFVGIRQRALGGHRLDAANARRDTRFGHDLEQADVAGALDVGAAAQLGGEIAHGQHAHLVPVFLPEQRHRARLDRRVVGHDARFDRVIGADGAIDERFDGADLLVGQRLRMRKIEARAVRIDERALLRDVRPEHLAQRRVHQMRGRMVPCRARARAARRPGRRRCPRP